MRATRSVWVVVSLTVLSSCNDDERRAVAVGGAGGSGAPIAIGQGGGGAAGGVGTGGAVTGGAGAVGGAGGNGGATVGGGESGAGNAAAIGGASGAGNGAAIGGASGSSTSTSAGGVSGAGGSSGAAGVGGKGGAGASGAAGLGGGAGTGGSGTSACVGASDGDHCAQSLAMASDPFDLLTCVGGVVAKTTSCAVGCDPAVDACGEYLIGGVGIASSGAGANKDPCAKCLSLKCGATVAQCEQETGCKALLACMDGCYGDPGCVHACALASPGPVATVIATFACANAQCAMECGPGPCATFGVPSDGHACGSALGGAADPTTLYTCAVYGASWRTSRALKCPSACVELAPGHAYCDGDPCGQITFPSKATFCGSGLGGPDNPNALLDSLYTCMDGVTQSVQACPNGCTLTHCN